MFNKGSHVYNSQIFLRDHGRCHICGMRALRGHDEYHPLKATIDHVIPIANGGQHKASNLRIAHSICNSIKGELLRPESFQARAQLEAVGTVIDLAWLYGAGPAGFAMQSAAVN